MEIIIIITDAEAPLTMYRSKFAKNATILSPLYCILLLACTKSDERPTLALLYRTAWCFFGSFFLHVQ